MNGRHRLTKAHGTIAAGLAVLLWCACAPGPRPTPLDFSGNWTGQTSQGRSISFTVSSGQLITTVSVEFAFGTCSGGTTFSTNAPLLNTAGTADAVVTNTPAGATGTGRTVVHFLFPSVTTANGTVDFVDFANCGNSSATWTATKR